MPTSAFITLLLSYERTEKIVPGPGGFSSEEERFGWVIRVNGVYHKQVGREAMAILEEDFPHFVLKNAQLELSCFEEEDLSYEKHDQFHPPMTLVTTLLDKITKRGYVNTSNSMAAEKNEITYILWSFQKPLPL